MVGSTASRQQDLPAFTHGHHRHPSHTRVTPPELHPSPTPPNTHLEDGAEEVAVPVLVLAPVLKVLEQRVQLVVGVALQVAVDGDVAPVANLLAQVGGVDDELGLEEGVLPVGGWGWGVGVGGRTVRDQSGIKSGVVVVVVVGGRGGGGGGGVGGPVRDRVGAQVMGLRRAAQTCTQPLLPPLF
jgi:hypothetical protein